MRYSNIQMTAKDIDVNWNSPQIDTYYDEAAIVIYPDPEYEYEPFKS